MPDDFIDPQLLQKLIYTFLCSFPYMILILYSFKGHWRFNNKVTFLIVFLSLTVQLTMVAVKLLTRNTYDTIWNIAASKTQICNTFGRFSGKQYRVCRMLIRSQN